MNMTVIIPERAHTHTHIDLQGCKSEQKQVASEGSKQNKGSMG